MECKQTTEKMWIQMLFQNRKQKGIPDMLFSGVIVSIPIILVFLPFMITRWETILMFTPKMRLGLICGGIWIWLGPYFIINYLKDLEGFFAALRKNKLLAKNIDKLQKTTTKGFNKFERFHIVWIICVVIVAAMDISYLEKFGIYGYGDIYLYIFLAALSYILYITAYGFCGVFTTMKLIRTLINDAALAVDYFNADGSGGFNCIKRFVLSTTKKFGTWVLFLPILLDYITYTQNIWAKTFLYSIVLFASACICISFYYPMRKAYSYAEEQKAKFLEFLGNKYKCFTDKCIDRSINGTIEEELLAMNVYNYMRLVKETSMYSLAFDTVIQVAVSILVPIIGYSINAQDINEILTTFFK